MSRYARVDAWRHALAAAQDRIEHAQTRWSSHRSRCAQCEAAYGDPAYACAEGQPVVRAVGEANAAYYALRLRQRAEEESDGSPT